MVEFRWAVVVLVGLLIQPYPVQSASQEQLDLIDALITSYQTDNFPGITLGVTQNDEIVIAKGYGKSNYVEDVPVENNTLFAVGSVSKGMCGLMVVKVLSEKYPELGSYVLDIPIAELAPELNFTLSERYRTQTTSFRDLLAHKTGIAGDQLLLDFEAASIDEAMYRTRYIPPEDSFRNGLYYSNQMIALAGYLASRISGKSYHELWADLYTQLDMRSSRIIDAEGVFEDLPNMSRAYDYDYDTEEIVEFDKSHLRRLSMAPGAAGVLSSAEDMAKFMRFYFNRGKVNGVQVIPEDVLDWMFQNSVEVKYGFDASTATGSYGYSLGLQLSLYEGQPWIQHPGYFSPYASAISLFPAYKHSSDSFGIFTSSNGFGFLGQHDTHVAIMKILKGEITSIDQMKEALKEEETKLKPMHNVLLEQLKNVKSTKHAKSKTKSGSVKKIAAVEFVGIYGNAQNGDITISIDPDNSENLKIKYGRLGVGNLIPALEDNTFTVEWTINNKLFGASIEFTSTDQLLLWYGGEYTFTRNATVDTFPVIPWSPDSCGPMVLQ